MAWYDSGTVAVTNGSTTVTGTGTNFITGAQAGEAFYGPDDKLYEIASITSATALVLADAYLGSTQSGQDYKIVPTQSLVADLASDVTDLIADYADVKDKAGAGKFNDGSVTAPGITFEQDQNNGLYRIGSDNYGLSAGGTKQIDISTTDVELNYSGSKKLATTNTGVDVTGTITADGLTVEGSTGITVRNDAAGANEPKLVFDNDTFAGANHAQIQTGNGGLQLLIESPSTSTFQNRHQIIMNGGGGDDVTFRLSTDNGSTYKNQLKIDNNDVEFYEDTGTTAKMVWDASAESLGIGTSTPSSQVDIYSSSSHANINVETTTGSSYSATYIAKSNGGRAESMYYNGVSNYWNVGVDSDGKYKITNNANGNMGTNQRFVIDSTGNVGIGTASPSGKIDIVGAGGQDTLALSKPSNGLPSIKFTGASSSSYLEGGDSLRIYTGATPAERARIDSSGTFMVNTTAPSFNPQVAIHTSKSYGLEIKANTGSTAPMFVRNANGVSGSRTQMFFMYDSTTIGSIGSTSTSTSYNTTSDERLKENIQDTTHSVNIDDIQVREFDWKVDGSHQRYGFIAQELETVYPEAVHSPDEADEMMSVDYSKLVPLLVKEIQTLKARIEELEK